MNEKENKKEKWKNDKCWREIDERRENKKKDLERIFEKEGKDSNTIMFENVNVKDLNTRTFIMFYIDDITLFEEIFISKFLLEFENFSKIESDTLIKAQTKEKRLKEK